MRHRYIILNSESFPSALFDEDSEQNLCICVVTFFLVNELSEHGRIHKRAYIEVVPFRCNFPVTQFKGRQTIQISGYLLLSV